jgi:hypothetical protein
MATRKQKARRAKTFRHEYGFVMEDEEGNEVEVPGTEVRGKKPDEKSAAKKTSGGGSAPRSRLAPKPPSWDRALKRGGGIGLGLGLLVTFVFHGPIVLGLLYGVMFIPLTYWTDGFAYRRWEQKHPSSERSSRPGKNR